MKENELYYDLLRLLVKPFIKLSYRFKVVGQENLPKEEGYIICSNHSSNIDPIIMALSHRKKVFFMAKAELFKNKAFAWLLDKFGAFPVSRGTGDKTAIYKAESILENKQTLCIFIEGTRSKDGELLKPKAGAAMIAYKMNANITPVCIATPKGGGLKLFKKSIISSFNIVPFVVIPKFVTLFG